MGIDLDQSDVARLTERTEGWAAGGAARRPVAARTATTGPSSSASSPATTATSPTTSATRSSPGCPIASGAFLLATAILDRFDAPLCDAVTGVDDAQDLLDELERRNLFIIPLDHRRQWFRYHHLFADWLRLQAPRRSRAPATGRAADWLADHHMPGDAIRHYSPPATPTAAPSSSTASDGSSSARAGRRRCGTGRSSSLETCSDAHPRLTLAAAWAAHHAGRWDDVHDLVEAFRDAQTDPPGRP